MEALRSLSSLVAEIRPLALAAVTLLGSFSPGLARTAPPPGDRWAAQTSPTTVTLAWTRLPNVLEYRIYEAEGRAFRLLAKARPSGDQYVMTVRPPWGVRRFAVEAVFEDGTTSEKGLFNEIRAEATTSGRSCLHQTACRQGSHGCRFPKGCEARLGDALGKHVPQDFSQ